MAITFLEPGGDADFAVATTNGFWNGGTATGTIATDFVHGTHIKSIKYSPGTNNQVGTGTICNNNLRFSAYIYLSALPNATATIITIKGFNDILSVRLTSGGVLQLWNPGVAQVGSDGSTLSTGTWYRLSLCFKQSGPVNNVIRFYKDGVIDISIDGAALSQNGATQFLLGNRDTNATLDFRSSDHYADNSSSPNDPGDIWVTAKRPNTNGTTNGFTTQIGVGGSGYGTGHSTQVNERPLSTTNGWSMVGAGAAVTEQYNIESASTGDIDISTYTIVGSLGWVSCSSLVGTTQNILLDGQSYSQAITSTNTLYTKVSNKSTYPAGTGTDIGIQTDTTLTTVSLYECGVLVAYIPVAPTVVVTPSAWISG